MHKTIAMTTLLLLGHGAVVHGNDELVAEVDAALVRWVESGQLPVGGEPLHVRQPPREHHELGAVLDLSVAADAAEVLALTPGGAAERLGLRVGDRVSTLNGVALGRTTDAAALRRAVAQASGLLALDVDRDGARLELRGEADTVVLPGYELVLVTPDPSQGCARISAEGTPLAPRVHPAVIIAIDGQRIEPEQRVFKVEPGLRRVTLAEAIDASRFNALQRLGRGGPVAGSTDVGGEADRRAQLMGRTAHAIPDPSRPDVAQVRHAQFKELLIDAKPDTTYRLGAEFHPHGVRSLREHAYWDPVVWRASTQPCR